MWRVWRSVEGGVGKCPHPNTPPPTPPSPRPNTLYHTSPNTSPHPNTLSHTSPHIFPYFPLHFFSPPPTLLYSPPHSPDTPPHTSPTPQHTFPQPPHSTTSSTPPLICTHTPTHYPTSLLTSHHTLSYPFPHIFAPNTLFPHPPHSPTPQHTSPHPNTLPHTHPILSITSPQTPSIFSHTSLDQLTCPVVSTANLIYSLVANRSVPGNSCVTSGSRDTVVQPYYREL